MDMPAVRAYAERCFASCSGDGERSVMQRKLHAIISGALANGRVREIDWASAPAPPLDRPEEPAPKRGVKLKFISHFHAGAMPCRRRHGRARARGRLCVDKSVKEENAKL